jgi:hypothetical protein
MIACIIWNGLQGIINSAFAISLVGAIAGAYAGAVAAQRISERNKERAEYQVQIRNTNAAITLSFMICNAAIALKKQHTKELCEGYFKQKDELAGVLKQRKANALASDIPFHFQANFQSVPFPAVPIDALSALVYEKLSVSRRPLALVASLSGALSSLGDVIANRDALIAKFKKNLPQERSPLLPALYFGLPYDGGNVSTEYPDTITGLQHLVDDVIYFSQLLCKDLEAHGAKVLGDFMSRFKQVHEQINSIVDFPDSDGLIPDDGQYAEWLRGFMK